MNRPFKIRLFDIESMPTDILDRRWPRSRWSDPELEKHVHAIINEVRKHGDSALLRFTKEFDDVALSADALRVKREEIESAHGEVKEEQVSALRFLKGRISTLKRKDWVG